MRKSLKSARGFTLVEVMIAGVILIITISAMTLVYRTAALSSGKASDNVSFSSSVGLIFNTIQRKIRGGYVTEPTTGEGSIAGVDYRWSSTLNQKKGAADRFDVDEGKWMKQADRFFLWDIELVVESGSRQRIYYFKELSWRK